MEDETFMVFVGELKGMKDNKAIAYYLQRRGELLDAQRILILETFVIQCIQKIAGLEHAIGKKIEVSS